MIEAAFDELIESGVAKTTMTSIARRANASKETLYSWFESRDGLFAAMIQHNADQTAERVGAALADASAADGLDTLTVFGGNLLRLLTDRRSLILNRAAMTIPSLASELLASGRHRVGPIVERYLLRLDELGLITIDDAAAAFETFYGLLLRDTQIRCLLGEPPPTPEQISARADEAVRQFVTLHPPRPI